MEYIVPDGANVEGVGSARNGLRLTGSLHKYLQASRLFLYPRPSRYFSVDDEPTARTPLSNLAPTVLRIVRSITLLNDAEATMLPTIRDLQLAPPNPYFVYRPDQDADVQLPPYWILEYAAVSATVVAFGVPSFWALVKSRQTAESASYDDEGSQAPSVAGSATRSAGEAASSGKGPDDTPDGDAPDDSRNDDDVPGGGDLAELNRTSRSNGSCGARRGAGRGCRGAGGGEKDQGWAGQRDTQRRGQSARASELASRVAADNENRGVLEHAGRPAIRQWLEEI